MPGQTPRTSVKPKDYLNPYDETEQQLYHNNHVRSVWHFIELFFYPYASKHFANDRYHEYPRFPKRLRLDKDI